MIKRLLRGWRVHGREAATVSRSRMMVGWSNATGSSQKQLRVGGMTESHAEKDPMRGLNVER